MSEKCKLFFFFYYWHWLLCFILLMYFYVIFVKGSLLLKPSKIAGILRQSSFSSFRLHELWSIILPSKYPGTKSKHKESSTLKIYIWMLCFCQWVYYKVFVFFYYNGCWMLILFTIWGIKILSWIQYVHLWIHSLPVNILCCVNWTKHYYIAA